MTTYTRLTAPGVIIFSTIGSTIGALVLYRVGMELTPEKLEKLTRGKLFHILGFEKEDVEETVGWFEKHGKRRFCSAAVCRLSEVWFQSRQEWHRCRFLCF